MKKNLMFLILMLLFVSTISLSQTIYPPTISSPTNGDVVSYSHWIQVEFDARGNGLAPGTYYYFDIYVNNIFVSQQTTSPFTLFRTNTTGPCTVKIVLMCRNNTSDPFHIGEIEMVDFTVVQTISISSDVLDDATVPIGTIVTFTPNVFPPSVMTISWEHYSPVSNNWASVNGNHFCFLTLDDVGMNKVRAKLYVNGILVSTSNEIVIYVQ